MLQTWSGSGQDSAGIDGSGEAGEGSGLLLLYSRCSLVEVGSVGRVCVSANGRMCLWTVQAVYG